MRGRALVAASAVTLFVTILAFGAQSSGTAFAAEAVTCTRVLGGSQTTNWYSKGDFESLVVPRDWERQSRGGQTIEDWDLGGSGWNTGVWSACGQDSPNGTPFVPVTHVMLHALPAHGEPSVDDVVQDLAAAIDGIRANLPDLIDITLMPPVGGDCPGVGLADVNPTVVAAIDLIAGGDVHVGPNVIVPDCSMFSDSAGHLTASGAAWVAEQVAAWFGTADSAPVADAGIDQTVQLASGATTIDVLLDATASTDDGTIVQYVWSENSSDIATGATPTVPFSEGTHTVTLTVTDDMANTDTDTVQITVNPPTSGLVADAGTDQTVQLADGATTIDVMLDASASTDDGTIVDYVWSENSSDIATGATPTVPFTEGTHTVTLTVTDDMANTDTDTVQITVNPPTSGLVYIADLDGLSTRVGKAWVAVVTATVLSDGQPVAGATVSGVWGGGTGATSCVTDGAGQCAVTSDEQGRRTESLQFTVTDVIAGGLAYDPSANADPDGDSDGTTIAVLKA